MRVVGLDQSYTGFGFSVDGDSKKRAFPTTRYKGPIPRLFAVERWLEEWLHLQVLPGVDLVVMEGYANGAKFGREMAGELGWAVKRTVFMTTGHAPLVVPPPSLKKFVTGKGNAKKNEMLLGVYKQWGVEFSDDNQADAFALEKFGLAYLGEGTLTKYQQEAVAAVRKVAV